MRGDDTSSPLTVFLRLLVLVGWRRGGAVARRRGGAVVRTLSSQSREPRKHLPGVHFITAEMPTITIYVLSL